MTVDTSPPSSLPPETTATSCQVLWSTQTGKAKACARRTSRILRERSTVHIQGAGFPFDETPIAFAKMGMPNLSSNDDAITFAHRSHIAPSLFLMFVSTTGDGEQCDSIRDTWKTLLQKSLPRDLFAGQRFAMFCLGDRAYGPQFCAAGRKLAVRLMQLGMASACEVGYGDDNTPNGGVFRDLDAWLEEKLLPILEPSAISVTADAAKYDIPTCPFRVIITNADNMAASHSDFSRAGECHNGDEWQHARFVDSYQEYFSHASPTTAYKYTSEAKRIVESIGKARPRGRSRTYPLIGTVIRNARITSPEWEQNTRGIRIQVAPSGREISVDGNNSNGVADLPYVAGDVASIMPFNSDEEVNRFLKVLPEPLSAIVDAVLEIDVDEKLMDSSFARWPRACTFRGWLTYCADIHSLPEREDMRALSAYYSPDHIFGMDQKRKLLALSETSESALYADYILREKRSWADVLYDFESLRAPGSRLSLQSLLMLIPPMRKRDFSIASAPSVEKLFANEDDPTKTFSNSFPIDLCVAVVEGTTRRGRKYHGLCSEFLSRMLPSTSEAIDVLKYPKICIWIRPGTFGKLPLDIVTHHSTHQQSFQVPILCVAAGTGVAPMRSLLMERNAIRELAASQSAKIEITDGTMFDGNENILVFGCRKQNADYYYEDEWEMLGRENRIRVLTAFSRDQVQRVYVQKVVREADDGNLIANHILNQRGAVYIAGGPKMARAVKEEIVEALAVSLGSEKQANQLINKMQIAGLFSIEAWS